MIEERDYQQRIIGKTTEAFLQGARNVLIESPAGAGKTIMAFSSLLNLLPHSQQLFKKPASEVKFGWVAMRRNLLAQAKKENEEKMHVPNVHYISMFDSNPPKMDMLILDEGHHDAANSSRHVYSTCEPAIALGLSATPFRQDRMQLCFDKTIKDAGYHRLIQDGWLSQYHQYMLKTFNPQTVTAAYLAERQKWGATLMFFYRISECMEAAKILMEAGVRCDVVTGSTDRFAQLDRFEAGELDVLINVYVLSEGFDYPALKTVFVRDSSRGPTIQMAGRVLRKHPDIPISNIVQSQTTKWPFVKTAKALQQFISTDNGWLSVGTNDNIESARTEMLNRLRVSTATLPKFLLDKLKKFSLNEGERNAH